ncbi:Protein angel 1 [Dissophora globulifera]|nr:Protein angel 1 [Dissophora globulifera]
MAKRVLLKAIPSHRLPFTLRATMAGPQQSRASARSRSVHGVAAVTSPLSAGTRLGPGVPLPATAATSTSTPTPPPQLTPQQQQEQVQLLQQIKRDLHRRQHQQQQSWQRYQQQDTRQSYRTTVQGYDNADYDNADYLDHSQHRQYKHLNRIRRANQKKAAHISSSSHNSNGTTKSRRQKGDTTRHWDRQLDSNDATFTIMSYNLLASSLIVANPHLYRECDQRALIWENRGRALISELEKLESHEKLDFYCFQELDYTDYEETFEPTFKKWGYTGYHKKRNGDKMDGCTLFFRSESVKALALQPVDYNENRFIGRDNVGIVGLFEIRRACGLNGRIIFLDFEGVKAERVCIATTHILFNPSRGMIKIAQLRMLLQKAKSLVDSQGADIPIILCGDLNALPHSTVINYLTAESVSVSLVPDHFLSGQTKGHIPVGHWNNGIAAFHQAFSDSNFSSNSSSSNNALVTTTTTTTTTTTSANANKATGHSFRFGRSGDVSHSVGSRSIINRRSGAASSSASASAAEIAGESVISQPFLLRSAYNISAPSRDAKGNVRVGMGKPFTTYHKMCKQICDYIFYGHLRNADGYSKAPKLELVACLELPCDVVEREIGLPTLEFGSDHLSLVSKFRFVRQSDAAESHLV